MYDYTNILVFQFNGDSCYYVLHQKYVYSVLIRLTTTEYKVIKRYELDNFRYVSIYSMQDSDGFIVEHSDKLLDEEFIRLYANNISATDSKYSFLYWIFIIFVGIAVYLVLHTITGGLF